MIPDGVRSDSGASDQNNQADRLGKDRLRVGLQ
jgi:hypothetical protein